MRCIYKLYLLVTTFLIESQSIKEILLVQQGQVCMLPLIRQDTEILNSDTMKPSPYITQQAPRHTLAVAPSSLVIIFLSELVIHYYLWIYVFCLIYIV